MVYASKKFWKQFLDLHSYLSILEILYEQICNCCVNTVHCRNQYYFKKKRCSPTIVYYLTFLEVLGCLSLSIALWDIPWVDFKAAYYEEVGIAATDHIKRAGHVLSVDTAGVQVPHYIYCLPSLATEGAGLASSCVYAHTVQWMSLYKTNPSLLAIVSKGVLATVRTSAMSCSCANGCTW